MADNIQTTQFPNGVTTPNIRNVSSIQYADGMTVTTTPSPVVLNIGNMNVGTLNFKLANGPAINGKYNIRVSINGVVSYANFEVSAQAFTGNPNIQHTINVISVSDIDRDILQFKAPYFLKNSTTNDVALAVSFITNSPGTSVITVICDAVGNPAPLGIAVDISNWNMSINAKVSDSRDTFTVMSNRSNGSTQSLNNITSPGTVTVSPTDTSSRPVGSDGYGTCTTYGSSDVTALTQTFHDNRTGAMYIRYMTSDNVTWSSWSKLLRESDFQELVNTIDRKVMLSSIIFG